MSLSPVPAAPTPPPRSLWARGITRGPWHKMTSPAGNTTMCGKTLGWARDNATYLDIPVGFGNGTVCPQCARIHRATSR